jgi:hypothetical protein
MRIRTLEAITRLHNQAAYATQDEFSLNKSGNLAEILHVKR